MDRYISSFAIGVAADIADPGIALVATADDGNALFAVNNSPTLAAMIAKADGESRPFQTFGATGHVYIDGAGIVDANGYATHSAFQSRIDHPLDPTQKYLNHAAIESSETLNLYSGNAVLGADGSASIQLPDWFTTINGDFRYQLTPIGGFAQLFIAEEITNNQFRIGGGHAGMKVSWQVTGIRQDAYTKMHPLVVESAKEGDDRGLYIHPEAFGQGKEMGVHAMEGREVALAKGNESWCRPGAGLKETLGRFKLTKPFSIVISTGAERSARIVLRSGETLCLPRGWISRKQMRPSLGFYEIQKN